MAVGGVGHSLRNTRREVKRVTDLYRKEMTQRKDLYNQLQVRVARLGFARYTACTMRGSGSARSVPRLFGLARADVRCGSTSASAQGEHPPGTAVRRNVSYCVATNYVAGAQGEHPRVLPCAAAQQRRKATR
jgi:hypothetical protein